MNQQKIRAVIEAGETALGIELGSTRIKAVLIDHNHAPVASGDYGWENRLEDGIWIYRLDDVWTGIQAAYATLVTDVRNRYHVDLKRVGALGVSAMMHGYLPFDGEGRQLVPFRTWRNTMTEEAAVELTDLFDFNIPQRWSVAHLYQSVLNKENHIKDVAFLTTLSGYVHWQLTGERVLGVGEASGMFPIDSTTGSYDMGMLQRFDGLLKAHALPFKLCQVLPQVLCAGQDAGALTAEGAARLDPSGGLECGIPLCPPEGDAGTGMVATNSVAPKTGNVSAGTSVFAMVVLERPLSQLYRAIDLVTTPTGLPVAMVHCNTCTSDLDAWVNLFGEVVQGLRLKLDKSELYKFLYGKALMADADCGGLVAFNCYSGEPVTGLTGGCPMLVRKPEAELTLPNLMRAHLYAAMATLKLGMDILLEGEHIVLERLQGHGGLFKVKGVAQQLLAGALNVPVAVLETAGEGGPWGAALLAAYLIRKEDGETLEHYLDAKVFPTATGDCIIPREVERAGFEKFMERYRATLAVECAAIEALK